MNKKLEESPGADGQERQPSPGERTAKAILACILWIKDLLGSFKISRPRARVISHRGKKLPDESAIRFPKILLVEDDAQTAQAVIDIIRHHYVYGHVTISFASCFTEALSFFTSDVIPFVIMDSDLNDENGNGAVLTEKFLLLRPKTIILANSSSRSANARMIDLGARASVNKNYAQLQSWLVENDPTGNG